MIMFKKEISKKVKELKAEHKELKESNHNYRKVLTAMGAYIDRLTGSAQSAASIAAPTHLSVSAFGESGGSSDQLTQHKGSSKT